MQNLEIKQIIDNIDEDNFKTMVDWMYNWWKKEYEETSLEEVECFLKHCFEKNRMPQTFGLFLDDKIIGMYQFIYDDLDVRPDIYPWLANFYIDENYRDKGYSKLMLDTIKENAKALNLDRLYIFTKHSGLYEKIGFEYVEDVDTINKKPRIQRLYKLNLK